MIAMCSKGKKIMTAKDAFHTLLVTIWQMGSRFYDWVAFHGCDFGSWVEQEEAGFAKEKGNRYQPSNGALRKVLAKLPITKKDRILDIGCGKGRAMAIMGKFAFGEVAGIEISNRLQETANKNFQKLGLKQCNTILADAAEFTDYDRFNYIYLFNPLPLPVFDQAMHHLCDSIRLHPRHCTLIYLNPVCHESLVEKTPFRLVKTYHSWCSWFEYRIYETSGYKE